MVEAILDDWRTAPIDEKLRAMLGFLEKLTLHPGDVDAKDIQPVRAAGVSDQAIEDAIYICVLFNMIDRVADALNFAIPSEESFTRAAISTLMDGYALIPPGQDR